jgi:hypothetical protein
MQMMSISTPNLSPFARILSEICQHLEICYILNFQRWQYSEHDQAQLIKNQTVKLHFIICLCEQGSLKLLVYRNFLSTYL